MLLNPLSTYRRRRLKILLHNLMTADPALRIRAKRSGDLFHLDVGGEQIAIVSINRWSKYRKGVAVHAEKLAKRYGVYGLRDELAGETVIDIGANIGELSLFCAREGARVFAIEPDPINYLALEKNTAGTDIKALPLALWEKEKTLTFYSSIQKADSSLIQPKDYTHTLKLQAIPLDRLTEEQGIEHVFLIKADAEGAEPEVLRGAGRTLQRTRFLSVDCGPERRGEKTFETCERLLVEMGYETKALDAEASVLFGINRHLNKGSS